MTIKEYLKNHRIVTDGAMGTYYAELKKQDSLVSEWANLLEPELIFKIHKDYLEAGADLIRTNTFAMSKRTLGVDEAQQRQMIKKAFEIAKNAVSEYEKETGKHCFIAADIGPVRQDDSEEILRNEYCNMVDMMMEEKPDVMLFETFSNPKDITEVITYVRQKNPDVFLMAEFSLNKNGYTAHGISANSIVSQMSRTAIDAVGFNCGIGSGHMMNIVANLKLPKNKYFCVAPNAGYPEQMQSRMVFVGNTVYFADNMKKIADSGAAILGSCCGSTPAYTKVLAEYVHSLPPVVSDETSISINCEEIGEDKKLNYEADSLYTKLQNKKIIAVELDPPFDAKDEKIIQSAQRLKELGVDVITIADSPQGRSRMDSVLTAIKLHQVTGMTVLPHISCRDRNMIAIRSMILGAYANDIRNFLFVTGDPVPGEARTNTTGVFDYNSVKLMDFVQQMNYEHFEQDAISFGGAVNQGRLNFDVELKRSVKKVEAGAKWFLSQPVYCEEEAARLELLKKETGAFVLPGILPPVNFRNASFIKNELVGINLPDEVLARYSPEMTKEEGENVGAEIAIEMMKKMEAFADGFYFMLPFNRISLLEKILKR